MYDYDKAVQEYSQKPKAELMEIAKALNITGRWDMTKSQLITAITIAEGYDQKTSDEYEDAQAQQRTTHDYVSDANIGTIVAFNVMLGGKQRVLSAKINGKTPAGHLLVETKNGSKYRVEPKDIVWVKTGSRWPKWVLECLKGEGSH